MSRGLIAAGTGLAVGLVAWWGAWGSLGSLLGTPDAALSPFALVTTAALVLGLALTAIALPASRASRADPLESLRAD